MKQILHWLQTNKTTLTGIAIAVLTFLTVKGFIDADTGVLIGGVLAAFGIFVSKDATKHSTTDQVKKADDKASGLK